MVEKVVAEDVVPKQEGAGVVTPPRHTTVEKGAPGSPPQTPPSDPGPGGAPQTTARDKPSGGLFGTVARPDGPGGPGGEEEPTDEGGPGQDSALDCNEIQRQMQALLDTLAAVHESNRDRAKKAVRAVKGNPSSRTYDGYAHWVTQAKITQAVVEGSNTAGKWMIDVGLFALGGWGGLGALGKGTSFVRSTSTVATVGEGGAMTFGRWSEVAQTASKLDKWLGTGIRGSKGTAEAYGKLATKILEKVADAAAPGAGKGGSAVAKTIDKMDKEWWQGGLGLGESLARGAIIDGIGSWMKEGASESAMTQAKQDYAEFATQAAAANTDAAAALGIEAKLKELKEQAAKKNCTVPAIPNYGFYTIDIAQFGAGMSEHEKGPSLHLNSLEEDIQGHWDLFAQSQPTPFG